MDDRTQADLQEVQDEKRETPSLVVVVELRHALLVDRVDSERHTGDDNRTGCESAK